MKNKKWLIITIISLVLILAEVGAFFVLIKPEMNRKKMLDAVQAGQGKQAASYKEDVKFFAEKKLDDDIKDILTYDTNQFIDGKMKYQDLVKVYNAVETIKDYKGLTKDYIVPANTKQLIDTYEKGYNEYVLNSTVGDVWDEFYDTYYVYLSNNESLIEKYDEKTVESVKGKFDEALNSYIQSKYEAFEADTLDYEAIDAYVKSAESLFINTEYVWELDSKLWNVKKYKDSLAEVEKLFNENDYFSVIDECKYALEWYKDEEMFAKYQDQFQKYYDDAFNTGKTFYIEQGKQLVTDGKIDDAQSLIYNLKYYYGDEFDTSEIEDLMIDPWKKAFLTLMNGDWKATVKADCAASVKVGTLYDSANLDFDSFVPDEATLYDLDGDGTPELILRNYDGGKYFIYAAEGTKAVFKGVIDWFGYDVNDDNSTTIVTFIDLKDDDAGVESVIIGCYSYKNGNFGDEQTLVATNNNGEVNYAVNGQAASEDQYQETLNAIDERDAYYPPSTSSIEDIVDKINNY